MHSALIALALAANAADPPAGCEEFDLALAGIGSLEEDLARVAALAGSAPAFPGLLRRPSNARPLWLCAGPAPRPEATPDPVPLPELRWALVPARLLARQLTGWADDRNDGALWAGRGLSASLGAGVRGRWRWFTFQLMPLVAWQENRDYPAPPGPAGLSPYANPYNRGSIDLPLRMGPSSFWTFDWGQSYLRAEALGLAAGFSNENLWWGPGIRNSLLMTNTGPGFPHLFVGSARPLDVWVGWLEAELGWGELRPSRWFNGDTGNRRLIEWAVYAFSPAFQRQLTVGMARVWLDPDRSVPVRSYFSPFTPPFVNVFDWKGDGARNGLASIFFRWAFPEVHFAVHGEWGRDDWAGDYGDFTGDMGHSQAYGFGFEKLFPAGRSWVRLQAELTHTFEMAPANQPRPIPIFYTHATEVQGYTQAGQMIGAGLGPQGDTEFLGVDWFTGGGSLGLFVERVARNERYYYDVIVPERGVMVRHDVSMTYGARGTWAWREWDLSWSAGATSRGAPGFKPPTEAFDATLGIAWWPGRSEAPVLPAPRRSPGVP